MNEQQEFEKFYKAHPEIAKCEANTNALRNYHNGDEITLQSLEESAPRLNLAKAGKRQSFEEFAAEHRVSNCEANRQLFSSGFDDPAVFAPMSQIELDELRAEAIENASPVELRQIAQRESAERRAATVQAESDRHIQAATARDSVMGFPSLPETWQGQKLDAAFIRNCDAKTQRILQSRFGSAALDLRLRGLN